MFSSHVEKPFKTFKVLLFIFNLPTEVSEAWLDWSFSGQEPSTPTTSDKPTWSMLSVLQAVSYKDRAMWLWIWIGPLDFGDLQGVLRLIIFLFLICLHHTDFWANLVQIFCLKRTDEGTVPSIKKTRKFEHFLIDFQCMYSHFTLYMFLLHGLCISQTICGHCAFPHFPVF